MIGVGGSLYELEQLIKEYNANTGERHIINEWEQLIKKYKGKNNVKNIIFEGRQVADAWGKESDGRKNEDAGKLFENDQRAEKNNLIYHLSRIVGVNMSRSITNKSDGGPQQRDAFYDKNWRENEMRCIQDVLPAIKDPCIASVMDRLETNWRNAKESLEKVFDESHFFIDDAFSCETDPHDIFSLFALEWLNKQAKDGQIDRTKCFWIAGDLSQLMRDKQNYSYEKFFTSYMDEITGIHDAVVWLDAVMRCSKSVFKEWEPVRKTILPSLGQEMFFEDNVTTNAGFRIQNKMLRARYGFHHPGSAIVLKPERFKHVVDLVKDITNRIKSLARDKSLTHSQFAVLCCDVSGHDMVLSAVQKQFRNDECLTQSIAEFHQDENQMGEQNGKRNKILLDLAENSVGLEWPVVFVICSDLHTKFDYKFTIQKYLACSRCRVRLFVYPELPSKLFKHGDGASCSVCKLVRRKKMLEGMRKLDSKQNQVSTTTATTVLPDPGSEACGALATSLDETFIVNQFESLYDQNEELEARIRILEREQMKMSQRLQIIENATNLYVQKE